MEDSCIRTALCKTFFPSLAFCSRFQMDKEAPIRLTGGDKGVQNAGCVIKAKGSFFGIKNPFRKGQ